MYIKKFNYFPLGLGTAFCLLMLLSLLLTACSNEASQARNEANNPDTRVQFGPGIYSARITSQQIKLYSDPSITNNLAGNWKLELRHDNSYQISLNNSMVTNGNYFIKGEYLIFQTGQWPNRCIGQANTSGAVYKWTVEDKSLSLSSNEEYCDMRRFVLTTSSFVQQQAWETTGLLLDSWEPQENRYFDRENQINLTVEELLEVAENRQKGDQ